MTDTVNSNSGFIRRESADTPNGQGPAATPPGAVDTTPTIGSKAAVVNVSRAARDFSTQFEGASVFPYGTGTAPQAPQADAPQPTASGVEPPAPPAEPPSGNGPWARIMKWASGLRPMQILKKRWLLSGMVIVMTAGVGLSAMGPGGLPGAIDRVQDSAYVQMKDTAAQIDSKLQQWVMITPGKPDATVNEAFVNNLKHGAASIGRSAAAWVDSAAEKIGDDQVKEYYRTQHARDDAGTTRPMPGTLAADDRDLPSAHKPEGLPHHRTLDKQDKNFEKMMQDLNGTAGQPQQPAAAPQQHGTKGAATPAAGHGAGKARHVIERQSNTSWYSSSALEQPAPMKASVGTVTYGGVQQAAPHGSAVTGGYDPAKVPTKMPSSAQRRVNATVDYGDVGGRPAVEVLNRGKSMTSDKNSGWVQIRVRDNNGEHVGRRAGRDIVRSTIGKKP